MKRIMMMTLTMMLCISAFAAPTPIPAPASTPEPSVFITPAPAMPVPTAPAGPLAGIIIGIDPGHQGKGNSEQEAIAPDSTETKAKVSSGTQGVASGVPEHEVNLTISLQLREILESMGAVVYMTRESADVDISNQERALMMNALDCHLVLRLHCNGSTNRDAKGVGTYVRETGACAEESAIAAELLLNAICLETEAEKDGVFKRDTYTGLNWSTVPCVMVEMGFMSNPEEDLLLNDADYQHKLAVGMANGIVEYIHWQPEETEG